VAYHPVGWAWADRRGPRFALYWMSRDGRRERLVADAALPCGQPIPVAPRKMGMRPSRVDYRRDDATCYVQDVHAGPGLAGVARGTVKRLRVVSLDFRAAGIGSNGSVGPGGAAKPQEGVPEACSRLVCLRHPDSQAIRATPVTIFAKR
jgi:hypothetical protein